eukprot:TRINITY_DN2274_c0_g1_i3.p2 TRINITY_DN2274_c0_g1~~TRINITY_DN2274_c0_g1_i3.p2  ORF type:complete len:53 (-),score=26.28 TRINITY_DN2274_c0_g1_i3:3-161(-)
MCEVKKPKIYPSPRTSSRGFECILSASRHKITKKKKYRLRGRSSETAKAHRG